MMLERGLNFRYIKDYYRQTWIQCPDAGVSQVNVQFSQVFSAFLLIPFGCTVGILCLSIEKLLKKYQSYTHTYFYPWEVQIH